MSEPDQRTSQDLLLFVVPGIALIVVALGVGQSVEPWAQYSLFGIAIVLMLVGIVRMARRLRTERRR